MKHKLAEAFHEFHTANPSVWQLFVRFSLDAIKAGHRRFSADAVLHRIRWQTTVETKTSSPHKIANAHAAFYARLFHREFPKYAGFFRTRVSAADLEASLS